ncbi:MAG: aminopeptidase P N-terminal domain-containing protein [Geitlerinemataceae cyanobacterium]
MQPSYIAPFAKRRQDFLAAIGDGTAILRSAPMAVMHNDVEYNFRQDSDFFYLTGFNESNAVAVFAPHHEEHQYVLFVEPKNIKTEIWTGYRTGVDAAKEKYGADEAYPIAELAEHLPKYLKHADRILYRFGHDEGFNTRMVGFWRSAMRRRSRDGYGPTAIEELGEYLHPMRVVKDHSEIEQMRRVADIAAQAHNLAMTIAQPKMYEYEVQAAIENIFAKQGGGPAYPSIVASGGNSCILHYVENNQQMGDRDLLLIDAGCELGYYNSDITRTFPVGGKFTPEQKAIYEIVLEAQLAALNAVAPGATYNEHHDAAVRVIVEGLLDLGLLVGKVDELIESKAYKPFYMHSTGHWLGLDVHDVGAYKYGEDWQELEAGNILTVEPGIYISPYIEPMEGQPAVDPKWHGIGVRIEDDVLVTGGGIDILTAAVPKSVEAMER